MKLKIQCPAKINLSLKVGKKDETTGFHPIKSVMQTISLYDYLTIETTEENYPMLSGNSNEIDYNENNLIIKAYNLFFEVAKIKPVGLKIYLEKNIPVAAGLAGGSTDAAGMILALNTLFPDILSSHDIYNINKKLGSDINFCYQGGIALCEGKGDDMTKLPFEEFNLTVVKPKRLKISTKDAYVAFDNLNTVSDMENDLEYALCPLYKELQYLGGLGFQMSGSGPSFFIKSSFIPYKFSKDDYDVFENLSAIPFGCKII